MDLSEAMAWAGTRNHAVLITIRGDGRPQSSDVTYAAVDGRLMISVTDDRAKTANMRRDERVVVHLTDPDSWSYASFDGTVELMPVTQAPDDATADALVRYFETVAGDHDDWDEYRRAMVTDKRLIVWFTPTSAVGQVNG